MDKNRIITLLCAAFLLFTACWAQDATPGVNPLAYYLDADNTWQETTSISDGEAPLEVTFRANPHDMGDHQVSYVWHFRKQGDEADFMVRYEEETTYRFVESGTFDITLNVTLDGDELTTQTLTVAISESKLEFPNAFSPNGDDTNEIFQAKEGYRSIVEFHAYIFNRWGQKLYEWTDPAGGWDGKHNGHPVKDGVYFLLVKARGADGRQYNIRKDVNLLRGLNENGTSSTTE